MAISDLRQSRIPVGPLRLTRIVSLRHGIIASLVQLALVEKNLMTDTPRRRLADHVSSSPTFIGAGSALTGDLQCGGDLVVAGSVHGDSTVRGSFTLSEGGRWEGRISAANAVVAGEVEGTLNVADKLEIRATARLRGALSARSIAVARGAVIEGEMAVTSGAAVVHYEEKRKPG
ncbi:MAG TPA: polymer-forming cytoskeletal protein [Steroidobacteraceae bacterium]|jgi:cytoskeletal protein CcmA (bactofilin family)|nr:polymer-forming cytoskeletal protein [Steroidobacteraceae bacterium]